MNIKDKWENFLDYFSSEKDYEYEEDIFDYEYDDEDDSEINNKKTTRALNNQFTNRASKSELSKKENSKVLKMMVVEPRKFDDAQLIADHLLKRKPIVINFEASESEVIKRVVDFISGATYALDGNIEKIGRNIFICVPNNITINKENNTYTDLSSPFSWKGR